MPVLDKKTLQRIFLGVSGCIVLYWLLHETERVKYFIGTVSGVLAPFIFGGVLAFVLNVPMRAIESGLLKNISNLACRRVLSVVLTLVAVLLVVSLVFWLLIPQIISTVNSLIPALSDFFARAKTTISNFLSDNPQMLEWLKSITDSMGSISEKILSVIGNSMSAIFSGGFSAISGVFSGMFDAVIGIVFCVYCLFQKETLARQGRKLLYAFIKEKNADRIIRVLRLTNSTFSNFLSGQCVEVCILGGLFAVCMAIFRMPYIPLICVVIAVSAFIPIVGAWVGCVLGAFLILVKSPMLAVIFVVMFLILQMVENNMIYPRVVGNSVGLSGMWVLVAVAVGGELMGVVGMFLMIPMVSVLYTLLQEATHAKLSESTVAAEKLQPQPPELVSKFKEKRKNKAKKTDKKKQEEASKE